MISACSTTTHIRTSKRQWPCDTRRFSSSFNRPASGRCDRDARPAAVRLNKDRPANLPTAQERRNPRMNQSPNTPPTNLSLIVAISQNGVIGRDGGLPWHLPEDLRRFKSLTMGHHIIMGRRTFESLGRCLPGRTNVVVTQGRAFEKSGATVVQSLPAALKIVGQDAEPFVIGGLRIFEAAWPLVQRIYLTRVLYDAEGDIRLDLNRWGLADATQWSCGESSEIEHSAANQIPFQFQTWQRSP